MNRGKKIYFGLLLLGVFLVSTMYFSYAFFTSINEEHGKLNIVAGTLDYKISGVEIENNQVTVSANSRKKIILKIASLNDINSKYELYYIVNNGVNVDVGYNSDTVDSVSGEIDANATKAITLSIRNNTSSSQIITFGVQGGLITDQLVLTKGNSISEFGVYAENILNGATPVLTDNLIPVSISDDGTVNKMNLYDKWYSYEDKSWANAVVLREKEVTTVKDSSGNGNDGTVYGNLVEGYGYASFDGVDDYIDSGVNYDFSQPFTIGLSFRYDNIGVRHRLINDGIFDLYINEYGGLSLSLSYITSEGVNGYSGIIVSASKFNQNNWYDILYTYDGNTLNCYLNGELVGTRNISSDIINDIGRSVKIGTNYDATKSYFTSRIGKVILYNNTFTNEDIINYFDDYAIVNDNMVFEYNFFDIYPEDLNIIEEENIESYFVWIPKYSYQLWDLGDYSSLTAIDSTKPYAIPIKFGLTNTSDSVVGECAAPGIAGESGNCKVGDYMTHPAFQSFDSNGFWVGKFETGYDGATTVTEAQINSSDSSKVIIKPNVYSWRNLTVGNMFKASYDYLRTDESHMIKNTEWGAVAYLSHSEYGTCSNSTCSEVRINNNGTHITGYAGTDQPTLGYNGGMNIEGNRVESTALSTDGTYTVNYLNSLSNIASTTGNKSGVYDLAGGSYEYVMGYTLGATTVGGSSELIDLYSDFFTNASWEKYYDKYSSTVNTNYNNRILGDATGEIGPFGSQIDPDTKVRYKSNWYSDYAYFMDSSNPWIARGGGWYLGNLSGIYAFNNDFGGIHIHISFRVALSP